MCEIIILLLYLNKSFFSFQSSEMTVTDTAKIDSGAPSTTTNNGVATTSDSSSPSDGIQSSDSNDNKDTAPPQTQINKIKYSPNVPLVKKDKRQNSSRFNIPVDRELQKLPVLRGKRLKSPGVDGL